MVALLWSLIHYALLFTAMLGPLTDERSELAVATAYQVYSDAPFYKNDDDKIRTLALHVAVAHREGSGRTSVIGDNGDSFCAYQIHKSSGGAKSLTENAYECASAGHVMLRKSIKVCRAFPIAWYAEGPKGCESERAKRISIDRENLAKYLIEHVHNR